MRLAFVTINGVSWGGSEVLWVKTAKLALEQGHDVLVSMFDFDELPEPIQELKQLGATFHFRRKFYPALGTRLKKKIQHKFASPQSQMTYHDYLLDYKADRIFFSLAGGDEIARDESDLMLFVKKSNIKYYIFCHSISTVPDTNARLNNNMRLSFQKADKVFFTSKMQVEMLEHQLMSQISNATVMAHPLNVSEAKYVTPTTGGAVRFALIGSLIVRHKGQDIALKALSGEEWKERDFILNIYGNGPDETYLKGLITFYGLDEKVFFCGYEKNAEKIWQQNDMLLVPSRQDSGPITVFEAMSCGRPVVGSRMGAMPDYIVDDVNGVVCEPFSYNSFKNALEKAWQQKDSWVAWGKASLEIIKKNYDFHSEQTLLNLITQ